MKEFESILSISNTNGASTAVLLILFILLIIVTSTFSRASSCCGSGGSEDISASSVSTIRLYNNTGILDLKYLGYTSDSSPSTMITVSRDYLTGIQQFVPQQVTYTCLDVNAFIKQAELSYELIYPDGRGGGVSYGTIKVKLRYDGCARPYFNSDGWTSSQPSAPYTRVNVIDWEQCRIEQK
ncbi:hypothetical protein M3223_14730 [Paenibacillus pasadenensis]|uniref:hypothetical protein n=1 Tax=Paenibacillus pasadenensis TaxID=217090 RepID=UPI00203DA8FE|nr:hypothetical protein [Paenibacillus pasadenensis]MCM3748604.1 hypothetical protein [Paenibacillus pasadenensis]